MKYTLTVRKEAEIDITEQFEYYEERRLGLGHDFLLCVEEALSKIERNPLIFKKIHKEIRRVAIRRFPYRIFFIVQGYKIIVTAVFHARRDPNSWQRRT